MLRCGARNSRGRRERLATEVFADQEKGATPTILLPSAITFLETLPVGLGLRLLINARIFPERPVEIAH